MQNNNETSIRLTLDSGVEIEIKSTITKHKSGEMFVLEWDDISLGDYFELELRLKEMMHRLKDRANAKAYRAMVARQPVKPANQPIRSKRFGRYDIQVERICIDEVAKYILDNREISLLKESGIDELSPENNFEFLLDVQTNILDVYFNATLYLESVLPDYDDRFVRPKKEYDIDTVVLENIKNLKHQKHKDRILMAEKKCLMEILSPLIACYKIHNDGKFL